MATKAKRHVHKYYRANMSSQKVWACALSDCNHYMPKHMEELVRGKNSICWKCGEDFILNPFHMKQDKPVCDDCALGLSEIQGTGIKTTVVEKVSEDTPTAEAILNFVRS